MITFQLKSITYRGCGMENGSETNKNVPIFGTLVFFASFIPYILIGVAGIKGINFGFGQGFGHFKGGDGMFIAGIELLLSGILPFSLIYQIVFGKNVIRYNKRLKKITLILIACLIPILIGIIPVSGAIAKTELKNEPEKIRSYLSEKYGEEMASELTIEYDREENYTYRFYNVKTAVLPDGYTFEVRVPLFHKNVYYDNLMDKFNEIHASYNSECESIARTKRFIPAEYRLIGTMNSIKFGNYHHGDDLSTLYDKTEYLYSRVSVDVTDFSDENIKNTIYDVLNNSYLKYSARNCENAFVIFICKNGSEAYITYLYPKSDKFEVRVYSTSNRSKIHLGFDIAY